MSAPPVVVATVLALLCNVAPGAYASTGSATAELSSTGASSGVQGLAQAVDVEIAPNGDHTFSLDIAQPYDRASLQSAVTEVNAQGVGVFLRRQLQAAYVAGPGAPSQDVPDVGATAATTDGGLQITVHPGDVIIDASWWVDATATAVGGLVYLALRSVCVATLTLSVAGLPASVVCASVGGFVGSLTRSMILMAADKTYAEPQAWGKALLNAVIAAIGAGAWDGGVKAWATDTLPGLLKGFGEGVKAIGDNVGLWFRTLGEFIRGSGQTLGEIAGYLPGLARALRATLDNATGPTAEPQDSAAPARTFTVKAGGTSFITTLPDNSVATYTWTDGGSPSEWLTTASGSGLKHKLQSVPVVQYAEPSDTITVEAGSTYQRIDGFGGAMTDAAAALILGSPQRDQIMGTLFGASDGQAGLTMVRSPMGSSDLMADGGDFHTYEDTRGSFSADGYASDKRQIDALLQAKRIAGGDFKLLGTPWSAPGWAKRGGSLKPKGCGTDENELDLKAVPDYAGYFRRYVDAYASKGLKPWMVSMQNEPENCKTEMPTTLLSPTDATALARELKRQLPGDVKVLGWDHNWNDKDYVNTLVGSGSVDAIGYHCYDGTHYNNQTRAVPTYMTECSGFTDQSGNVASNLGWEMANLLIGPLRNGSQGSIYWSLAQDPGGNPHLGGSDACKTCRGMVTVNGGGFEPSQDFYYWAQLSKFVRPGAVRVDSNNSGDLSTVAFRDGNRTTLVVLNSTTHADGGSAGSDERDLRGHILQYSGETAAQKTAWLVGADGYRRWISDGSTFNCLKYDADMQGPDSEPGGALDKYINFKDVWAVCGATTMGTNSELEIGTYLKSSGGARLTLTKDGLRSVDASGKARWAYGGERNGIGSDPLTGDRLILQEDQNLVLYSGVHPIWSSDTKGSGAIWLSVRDDGTFALFNKSNEKVWTSQVNAREYRGTIVQWDSDPAAQKTSWLVGNDGQRRVIHDWDTFKCLHEAGAGDSLSVSSDVLDKLPDLNNVWATCGGDRISTNGALEQGNALKAGDFTLTLTKDDLVLAKNGKKVMSPSSGKGGAQLKLQTDGNLVVYDENGQATWSTSTFFGAPDGTTGWLILSDDGSLDLYGKYPDGKDWHLILW